jgi:thiol:disulfide interchange protein
MVCLLFLSAVPGRGAEFFDPPGGFGGNAFGGPGLDAKHAAVTAQFATAKDGQPARLFITTTIVPNWYTYSITQKPGGPIRTVITVDESKDLRLLGSFVAYPAPAKKAERDFDNLIVEKHTGTFTWYAPIELTAGVDPAALKITGKVAMQLCDPGSCVPEDYTWTASLGPGVEIPTAAAQEAAADIPDEATPSNTKEPVVLSNLLVQLGFAFLGGLILNLMPCVLPVISLKILSFLEQAGESRGRIFALNAWYAAGIMSVFIVLAALAAGAGLAWGEQFTLPWFKVAMTALVFAMALSFLGVWEIPIPGFVGRGRVGELQVQEGAKGAFAKGVFTTILATPCSGPFLGPVFGYLLTQPPVVAYLIFGAVGLGMASPYLVVGAFPKLIKKLPRPGEWMETVKQLMAFLLLGTVIYLFTTLNPIYFIPTLTLLMGLWFGCWWIGRTPLTAEPGARAFAWAGGTLSAAAIGLFAFLVLLAPANIPWQPFSPDAVAKARAEGKTVMVDFSANWCLTCKANLKFAIDTRAVAAKVEENQVVPVLADWTDKSPVIKEALNKLGSNSIPLLAIYPAGGSDKDVIILRDVLTEGQVLEALEKAGASKETAASGKTP